MITECYVVYIFSLNTFQDCQSAVCLGPGWFNIIENMSILSVLYVRLFTC